LISPAACCKEWPSVSHLAAMGRPSVEIHPRGLLPDQQERNKHSPRNRSVVQNPCNCVASSILANGTSRQLGELRFVVLIRSAPIQAWHSIRSPTEKDLSESVT
jgi:hypothetical protein